MAIRVAACHSAPIFLSARRTAEKAVSLIQEASKNKANLVVFPETYIPAFPIWSSLRPPTENHELFKSMAQESVHVDGEEIKAIRDAASKANVLVSLGISEKVRYSAATLFNSNVLISEEGEILVHHRKLIPTFFEKLTWSPGDGHGLRVANTRWGKVGNLICGENTNPLARYSLIAQGEQLHISSWPAIWPTRGSATPESSSGDDDTINAIRRDTRARSKKNYDNVSANRTRAAAHCFEAKCFGVLCSGYLDDSAKELIVAGSGEPKKVADVLQRSPNGATMFLDPTGALLPGFTVDKETSKTQERELLQTEEGILYADMDLGECIEGKQYHDVVGGYQRLDVFKLEVDRRRREPAIFIDEKCNA